MAGFENDVMVAKNLNFDESAAKPHLGIINAAGKLPIGTGNSFPTPEILAGSLTSPDSSITFGYSSPNITAVVTGGSTSVLTLTGNSGLATPSAGNINVITANSTVKFVGSGSTLTQDFDLTSNLVLGTSLPALAGGIENSALGRGVLASLTSGNGNIAMGNKAGNSITSGGANTLLGHNSGRTVSTSQRNTAVGNSSLNIFSTGAANAGSNSAFGTQSLLNLITGIKNSCFGDSSLSQIATGTNNIAFGYQAGQSHTAADSSNIDIGNLGTVGESNIIRIGTQGSGTGQQNQCYLAGVLNTVSGRVVAITTPGAYPYTTLITDYVILVDTSSARTITPLAAPVTGTTYRIKDSVGSAAANNITITPSGKNIDGAASYVINNAYGSVDIVYNGTEWSKF